MTRESSAGPSKVRVMARRPRRRAVSHDQLLASPPPQSLPYDVFSRLFCPIGGRSLPHLGIDHSARESEY